MILIVNKKKKMFLIITKELNYLDDICNIDNILKQNDQFDDDFVFSRLFIDFQSCITFFVGF